MLGFRVAVIGTLICSFFGVGALAETRGMTAFAAKYKTSGEAKEFEIASDGKGRICSTRLALHQILDFKNNECIFVDAKKRLVTERTLLPTDEDVLLTAEVSPPWVKVGEETIAEHPCDKYKNGKSQVWIGKDIHRVVQLDEVDAFSSTTVQLKEFSSHPPEANLFAIPKGYTVRHTASR